ncbi:nucleotide sugar dehydrogenase [Bacillus cereus group sp. BfR-BA-01380]|uniref:nucleotide sugar dehydrogenase n=1 Tax=Bacillus cereus group sp. BfR-BA-01380 TaxID=2920324 RepID=UPI001F561AB9|nr:nucleotide sugar dehydrogenase [Bacillus cereus group sp. BfR-BA-01380]
MPKNINFQSGKLKIGVIGLGYVGLPLALLFTQKGFQVLGIDIDQNKIESLAKGISYILDIQDEYLNQLITNGDFRVSSNYHDLKDFDVIIICVPTPLSADNTPDLSYLQTTGKKLIPWLKKDQLIILESSTYPGTTREVIQPLLEKSGLTIGKDLYLAYSPERVDPGNRAFLLEEIPKVVSGVTDSCLKNIYDLYCQIFKKVIPVSSTEVAEMTKILENSFRFINISFINEIAILCDTLKINVWEVIDAAKTKPFGYTPFFPGPGIGGHCIPIDPLYLQWKVKQNGFDTQFINLSHQINQSIPHYVVNQVQRLIQDKENPSILIYGVTYKKDINDLRESPAYPIIENLKALGTIVYYHDPYVNEINIAGQKMVSVPLNDQLYQKIDCIIILVDHTQIPIHEMMEKAKIIYDTRNITQGLSGKAKVFLLGAG